MNQDLPSASKDASPNQDLPPAAEDLLSAPNQDLPVDREIETAMMTAATNVRLWIFHPMMKKSLTWETSATTLVVADRHIGVHYKNYVHKAYCKEMLVRS